MRWADLDSLRHVNNVRYVDYAREAVEQLAAEGLIAGDQPVSRMKIDYLRPLKLSREPVRISNELNGTRLVQEICAGDTVYATVSTDFGAPKPLALASPSGAIHQARLRRTDLGRDGHVAVAKVFELFQEARILHFATLKGEHVAGSFVVATVAVNFVRPIGWRSEPLAIESWVAGVGNSSLRISSCIVDDNGVLAGCDAVLVGFDLATQKSRPFGAAERAALSATIHTP